MRRTKKEVKEIFMFYTGDVGPEQEELKKQGDELLASSELTPAAREWLEWWWSQAHFDEDAQEGASSETGVCTGEQSSGLDFDGPAPGEQEICELEHQSPFSSIKVEQRVTTIGSVLGRLEESEVNLAPEYQRQAGLWSKEAKSRFIESMLLGIPLPSFYFAEDRQGGIEVVDGLQRITAASGFVLDGYQLKGLRVMTAANGKRFSELPRKWQRKIEDTNIQVNTILAGNSPQLKVEVFARINMGGVRLNQQEIRNALFPSAKRILDSMLLDPRFPQDAKNMRQQSVQLALRCVGFAGLEAEDCYSTLGALLADTMAGITPEAAEKALVALGLCRDILGERFARKPGKKSSHKALFDPWLFCASRLTPEQAATAVELGEGIADEHDALLEQERYGRSCDVSTSNAAAVSVRIRTVRALLEQHVGVLG